MQLRCILRDHETFTAYLRKDITNVQNSQQDSEKSLKALLDMIVSDMHHVLLLLLTI
jgi:flagellar hook-basal body complex protein FliE